MNEVEFENIFMGRIVSDKQFLAGVYSCGIPDEVAQYPYREDNQLLLTKLFEYFGKSGQLPTIEVLRSFTDENSIKPLSEAWERAKASASSSLTRLDPNLLPFLSSEFIGSLNDLLSVFLFKYFYSIIN